MPETNASAPWVVLATGTIDPKGMRLTARSDPALRLEDYKHALKLWRASTSLPFVFCENSGADLRPLQDALGADADRIEWLGFTAPDFPEQRGKGYGEALILRHALDHSKLIGEETRLFKTTGRLFVRNFPRIEEALRQSAPDVACDLNPMTLQDSDCRLFSASKPFMRDYLLPEAETMDELAQPMINFERVLSRAVLKAVADGRSWRDLPDTPQYEGFSGTFGHQYRNRRYVLKAGWRRLRHLANHRWW